MFGGICERIRTNFRYKSADGPKIRLPPGQSSAPELGVCGRFTEGSGPVEDRRLHCADFRLRNAAAALNGGTNDAAKAEKTKGG